MHEEENDELVNCIASEDSADEVDNIGVENHWNQLAELCASSELDLQFESPEAKENWIKDAEMRIKRYKKIQRRIGFFEKNFGFRRPFQILIDGTFAQAALQAKVNIREQLPKYLDGPVKLLVTPCIVIETEKIGPELHGALQILKQFPTHKCSHSDAPKRGRACIMSMVKPVNPNRYVVATQDVTLRERLRKIPGVALLYLHGNAPTIEKESDMSIEYSQNKNSDKLEVTDYQKEILTKLKVDAFGETSTNEPHRGKRKKKGGPNPLSCKKSKKRKLNNNNESKQKDASDEKAKRKRKRVKRKIPKHVLAEIGGSGGS